MTSAGITTDYVYDGTTLVEEDTQTTNSSGVVNLQPSVLYFQGNSGPAYRLNLLSDAANPRWYVSTASAQWSARWMQRVI